MTSQKVQSRLIVQNNSVHKNILNALPKEGVSVFSLNWSFRNIVKNSEIIFFI